MVKIISICYVFHSSCWPPPSTSWPRRAYFTSLSSHTPEGGNLKICTNQISLDLLEKKPSVKKKIRNKVNTSIPRWIPSVLFCYWKVTWAGTELAALQQKAWQSDGNTNSPAKRQTPGRTHHRAQGAPGPCLRTSPGPDPSPTTPVSAGLLGLPGARSLWHHVTMTSHSLAGCLLLGFL